MDRGFPKEILFQSIEDRIKHFENRTMGHPKLVKSYEDLMEKFETLSGKGKVLLVYGPSGVGKSTLLKKVRSEFFNKYYEEMTEDKGLIPVLSMETFAPEDGKFDWIDFYFEALRNLQEILIEDKRLPLTEIGVTIPTDKTKRKLRNALVNAVKYRKVKVILIDEAQHMTKVGNSKGLRNHMDAIKSLASKLEIPIILFGTYELLSFRNINGQLGRRTTEVHFSRYNSKLEDEIKAFKYILLYFQRAYPLHEEPDLLSEWKYFYKHTIGCVGTLKDWLNDTFNYKMKQNEETESLILSDFKKFEPTIDQAFLMAEDIRRGETQLKEKREEKESKLDSWLGLDHQEEKEEIKRNTNKRPGERKPGRDKTGTEF
ncbi:TniB family NTP-binding protein [Halalkalibacter urbisdiaboli]|uniref:TniB family NTP-binding protein n=1 Tax=Halalkalibacter urbisdiaboli TaxID=1960589 RepID=UPI000B4485C0|nr:TniB family NTP-binding protein [Halalkalibacter urbisdiaboli]